MVVNPGFKLGFTKFKIVQCLNTESCNAGFVNRDVEAETEAGSESGGSSTFSVEAEAEARKIHRFRFHIRGGRMEREKKLVLLSFVEERIGGA